MSQPPLLEASRIFKSFAGRPVLAGLDLSVAGAEIVAVGGENGAGKTTLLQILAGLVRPDAGAREMRGRIGYCPQQPLVFERLSVRENLEFFAAAYGLREWTPVARELLGKFRLEGQARELVATISGGSRQKLNLVLALLHDPDVLLLDEPYSGLDWEAYVQFWDHARQLRDRGKALLVVSHLVHERNRYDRVLELRGGRLQCP